MILNLLINALSFYVAAYVIPGVHIKNWQTLAVLAVVWGVLCALVKPILVFLTLPINMITLGLFTFVINAALIMLAARIVPGFTVDSFLTALLASVVLTIISGVLRKLSK